MPDNGAPGDQLQRVLLEDANARCVIVRLEHSLRQVLERGHYSSTLRGLLAETLVVTALCSSGIKFRGRVSLQLRSSGPLSLLMADCTDDGGLRGLARYDGEADPGGSDLRELAPGGVLTMTLEPSGHGQTYQGIVPMEGGGIGDAIEGYFRQSEQLETRIVLAVGNGSAAGLLLQKLPGEASDPDGWNRAGHLIETLTPEELLDNDAETLLHRLFHEESRRLFPARPLRFECPCSRERVASALRSLGREEIEDILRSQGEVDVDCQFCNERYVFDRLDLEGLLRSDAPEAPDGGSVH